MTSVTRLAGTSEAVTTSFTYEPNFNKVATITDPLNHTTTFGYDPKGNLTSLTDPLNHQTTFAYNSAGQLTSSIDALQNTTQFTYEFGDLATVTDPLNRTYSRFSDSAGRVASGTNPLGHITRYDYDSLNRLLSISDPLQGVTSFTYDPNDNLLSLTDARNNATTYTYDPMNRVATRKDPLLREESYLYNNGGDLQQHTDRKSQVTGYIYDKLNRLKQATYADNSTVTYTYDAGDRLTQVVDSVSGTISRGYDNLNRLTSETTAQGVVSYTHDAAGRRSSMTVQGQSTVNYTYDNADRLTTITQGSNTVAFGYDNANRRTSLTLPNGVLVEYGYDLASQLSSIDYKLGQTLLGNLTYEYDVSGNRTKVGGSFARTGLPQAIPSASHNAANHLTNWNGASLTYDLNGNLTNDGGNTYTWDARDQLVAISGSLNAGFQYDATGRRANKTVNGATTGFMYDGANPVQELSSGTPSANLLTGLGIDEVFMRSDGSVARTLIADGLGSAVALLDAAGVAQTQYTYEPFGKTTVAGSENSNSLQYTGRENDNTGLYYYRARYYNPVLQRFISEDPIGFRAGDPNLYAYVFNSPTNFTDPTGEVIPPLLLGAMGKIAGGVIRDTISDVLNGKNFEDAFNDSLKNNLLDPSNWLGKGSKDPCNFKKGQKQKPNPPKKKEGKLPRKPPETVEDALDNKRGIEKEWPENPAGKQETAIEKMLRELLGPKTPDQK